MKRRDHYYVSRKHPLVWLAALSALCAAVGYIANVTCGKGAGVSGAMVWLRVVLPVLAAVYFVYQVLVHGEERVYRAASSYWMLMLSFVAATFTLGLAWYWVVLLVLADLILAYLFGRVISGTLLQDWALIPLAGIPLAGIVWACNETLHAGFSWQGWLAFLPDCLLLLAFVLLTFALKKHPADVLPSGCIIVIFICGSRLPLYCSTGWSKISSWPSLALHFLDKHSISDFSVPAWIDG